MLAPTTGCSEEDPAKDIDACIEASINQGKKSNWIQGVWRLSATGKRTDCVDKAYNTESLEIHAEGIRVHQQGHYIFLENSAHHEGFSLSGLVGDKCIHIRTTEKTSVGVITYDLPAFFIGQSTFKGSFRGTGPEGCKAEGTFTVYAKLDPLPAKASNPAPDDAGTPQSVLCAACYHGCEGVGTEYMEECEKGCENFICKVPVDGGPDAPPPSDAADEPAIEAGVDAVAEAAPDAEEDAQPDGGVEDAEADGDTLDGEADGEAQDAEVDGEVQDAEADGEVQDAVGDAPEDAEPDAEEAGSLPEAGQDASVSNGPDYVLWDGAVEIDLPDGLPDPGSCSVPGRRGAAPVGAGFVLVGALGLALLRRRRRAAAD
jgi:hypothetical protein